MSRLPTPPWTQPSRLLRSLWLPHRSRNRSQPSPRSTNSSWRMLLPNSLLRLSTISLALPVSNPPYRHRRSNRWSTPPPRHTRMSSSPTPMPDDGCSEHSLRDPRRPRPGFLHLRLLVRPHHLTLHPYTLDNHSSTTWRLSLFLPSKGWIVWSSPGSSGQSLLSYKTLFATVVALFASLVLPSRSSSSATARLILSTSMLPSRHSSIGATPPSTTAR